jgi:exosortase
MAYRFFPFTRPVSPALAGTGVVCLGAILWSYWPTLAEVADRWVHDPLYSHGFLVPVFAAVLVWARRSEFQAERARTSLWGLVVLASGIGLRLVGARFHFNYFDAISLLPCLAGLMLLVGGWETLRWTWPGILFLAFMIPLPYRLGEALADPLRSLATPICTFVLQTLGIPALSEGHRILMDEVDLDVVGECSGLRMLVIFFALSTAVAVLARRPLWEKLVILFSAIPIAIIANVARITATGLFLEKAGTSFSEAIHEWAGLAMMPVGLVLLALELTYLNHLLIDPNRAASPSRP